MAGAISGACVSSAKCPVSKNGTTAAGMSRLNASAPGGRKSWAGLCQADALDAAHLCSLSPTASAHVHLRVVEAEGFDFDAFAFRLAHLFPSRSGPAESSSGSDRQSGVMRAPRCGTSVTR